MEDGADHLVRNVLPPVPLRQWVLSLPRRVRFLAARHPALASRLLDMFTRAAFAWQRRCARRLVVDFLKKQGKPVYDESILKARDSNGENGRDRDDGDDPVYDQAIELVARMEEVSVSKLQREMRLGYNPGPLVGAPA